MHYRVSKLPVSTNNPKESYCHPPREFDQESRRSTRSSTSSEVSNDLRQPWNIYMFASSSTLHGFSHVFAPHHSSLRRFAWTVAFLTSLTLFLLQSSNRALYYSNYPHVTRIDEVTAGNLIFPAITICNMNELRFSQLTVNDMFHAGKLLGFTDEKDNLIIPGFLDNLNRSPANTSPMRTIRKRLEGLTNFTNMPKNTEFNMFEFYNRTGHSMKDMLLNCTYRGTLCDYKNFTESQKQAKPSDFNFFASNSTFHGISHIFKSGRFTFRKAIWAFAFFSSLAWFVTQAIDRYAYFRTNPHMTKLDEQEAMTMTFPAITICNLNSFRLSALTTDDFYYAGNYIFNLLDEDYGLRDMRFQHNLTWQSVERRIRPILDQRKDYQPTKTVNMFDLYNRTGHTYSGMLKSCRYRGDKCNDTQWTPVFTRYGKCYTFNTGPNPLTTLKGGVDNGLEIMLDTQQDDYMPVWAETDEISIEAGFKVQIHKQSEPPFIHELGFGISPGFQTLVATQEQRITFLPSPWGNCIESFDKSQHFHFDVYSISACRITCETKFVYKNCECRMVHMPGDGVPYCTAEDYKSCADGALDFLVKKDVTKCVCDTPCNVTRYNLEMSALQLPSTQALSYLAYKYGKTEDYVRNNFAKLNVFFEALNYETIEQKVAYEIPGLLGDIGGQMGLFIGASILTILELFDYFYEVLKENTWGRKAKKKKEDEENGRVGRSEEVQPADPDKSYVATNHAAASNQDRYGRQTMYNTFSNGQAKQTPYISPPYNAAVQYRRDEENVIMDDGRCTLLPPVQYMGNSMSFSHEEPRDVRKSNRAFAVSNCSSVHKSGLHRQGRETSASYSELYRPVTASWKPEDETKSQYNLPMSSFRAYVANTPPDAGASSQMLASLPQNAGPSSQSRPESSLFSPVSVMSTDDGHIAPAAYALPSTVRRRPEAHGYSMSMETEIH